MHNRIRFLSNSWSKMVCYFFCCCTRVKFDDHFIAGRSLREYLISGARAWNYLKLSLFHRFPMVSSSESSLAYLFSGLRWSYVLQKFWISQHYQRQFLQSHDKTAGCRRDVWIYEFAIMSFFFAIWMVFLPFSLE